MLKFANDNLYAVDIDLIGTKLTRAMMIVARDGSTHARGRRDSHSTLERQVSRLLGDLGDTAAAAAASVRED